MKRLITIDNRSFDPAAPVQNPDTYRQRRASRGVVLGPNGEVYLLFVGLHNYHKLPGGGIDEGETPEEALHRELEEEIGCTVNITTELGEIVEHREYPEETLNQISYAYLCQQVGEKVPNSLEQGEIEEQLTEVVASSIDEAIQLLENDKPDNNEGNFIRLRDLTLLRTAKDTL